LDPALVFKKNRKTVVGKQRGSEENEKAGRRTLSRVGINRKISLKKQREGGVIVSEKLASLLWIIMGENERVKRVSYRV